MVAVVKLLGGVRGALFAGVAIVALAWGVSQNIAKNYAKVKYDKAVAAHAKEKSEAERENASRYKALAEDFAIVDSTYQRALQNAEAKRSAVVADLRSTRLQLREHWTCPAADAPGVGGADERVRLREEGAASLVQIGAEADAQIVGLQQVIKELQEKYDGEVRTGSK